MDEIEVYKKTMGKQAQRIANLTLDLDLAHAQIELLNDEIKTIKEGKEKDSK